VNIIDEKNKQPSIASITFRTSPTYKNYLEKWASGVNWSVSELLNNWVRRAIFSNIAERAKKKAHMETAPLFGVPVKMVLAIDTPDDWKKFKELVGEEKCEAYFIRWEEARENAADAIAESEGFIWNYDTPTGLIG